ncbi:hypothetical protein [Rhizobium sp. CECT 9324]|uniref:hypothetical protein n=1 Tax=Rhizobium sp. CECT 9324 TaxID=2845820 RepID=UPI001E4578F1|nr:hypothetical protein [Rhizobium sp. CECT 9324]CAH0341881.1 hypothetical protein RHI9324_03589 [Rhizobium sp. CECT 9324]
MALPLCPFAPLAGRRSRQGDEGQSPPDIGKTDTAILTNEFANADFSLHLSNREQNAVKMRPLKNRETSR